MGSPVTCHVCGNALRDQDRRRGLPRCACLVCGTATVEERIYSLEVQRERLQTALTQARQQARDEALEEAAVRVGRLLGDAKIDAEAKGLDRETAQERADWVDDLEALQADIRALKSAGRGEGADA